VIAHEAVFPLVVRHRPIGVAFGATPSARRGSGADVAGSRPYRAGDDMHAIDWAASARLSASRAEDAFIVRECFADESPCSVVVSDRRPAMALYPEGLPWLRKPDAMRIAADLIVASTVRARGAVGSLDYGAGDREPDWQPPSMSAGWSFDVPLAEKPFAAPEDNLELALHHLGLLRGALPRGTFVFILSDFVAPPSDEVWLAAVERHWDVVPVVIQDPVWEASFPDVSGLLVPYLDAASGRVVRVRMSRRAAAAQRALNEQRLHEQLRFFLALGIDPVVIGAAEPDAILTAFLAWADRRLVVRGRTGR
jgi:uncharacterized protein (DUF58 family)